MTLVSTTTTRQTDGDPMEIQLGATNTIGAIVQNVFDHHGYKSFAITIQTGLLYT
jgi:hypothetical protein